MSTPGWYPDPHDPVQWRFWDGEQWTGQTSRSGEGAKIEPPPDARAEPERTAIRPRPQIPGSPPPYLPPPPRYPAAPPPQRRRRGLVLGVLGAVLALALGAGGLVVLVGGSGGDGTDRADDPAPSRTEESSDPSSEPTSAPTTTTTPSPTTKPKPPPPPPGGKRCNHGRPTDRADHQSSDPRVKGGGLAMARPPGFKNVPRKSDFPFGDDVMVVAGGERYLDVLGSIDRAGYRTPAQATRALVTCLARTETLVSGRRLNVKDYQGFTASVVDAPASSAVATLVNPDAPKKAIDVAVIVVDLGKPDRYAFFIGFVPVGDDALFAARRQAADTLERE